MTHAIEWLNRPGTKGETWNPIRARSKATGKVGWFCVHASDGCRHCYAEKMNGWRGNGVRFRQQDRERVELFLDEKTLAKPLHWRKPRTVFPCDMTDLFLDAHPDEWIARIIGRLYDKHVFIILTKRAERMRAFFEACGDKEGLGWITHDGTPPAKSYGGTGIIVGRSDRWPKPNLWLGVSAEDQKTADERIPLLLDTPAAVRFVSYEPALGAVDFERICILPQMPGSARAGIHLDALSGKHFESGVPYSESGLDWVIVGGESGDRARPMHPAWARSARDQCAAAGVPFFFKQWGEWGPSKTIDPHFERVAVFPDGRVREWPA